MEIETLNAMNEGMHPGLMMVIKALVQITVCFAIAGIAISLACIAWLCFEETRQPARRQMKTAPEPPETDEYDLRLMDVAKVKWPGTPTLSIAERRELPTKISG